MALVIAVWPNNTISLVRMWNEFTMLDLFTQLDHEADPLDAQCWLVRRDDDGMHVTFDWKDMDDDEPVSPKSRNHSHAPGMQLMCSIAWHKNRNDMNDRDCSASVRPANILISTAKRESLGENSMVANILLLT
mgnify:CR=1 FL=1